LERFRYGADVDEFGAVGTAVGAITGDARSSVAFPSIRAARGVMLGLLLGDALGAHRGSVPATGLLRAGAGGQLACWTVEGLIRAHVRGSHKGITTPSGVVWYAYHRWAHLRGDLSAPIDDDSWFSTGWLAGVPALAYRRGSAPATTAAIKKGRRGALEQPAGTSLGAHAVTRTLPAGLCDWWASRSGIAAEVAALTHAGTAVAAAALGADLIHSLSHGESMADAVVTATKTTARRGLAPIAVDLQHLLQLSRGTPRDRTILQDLTPEATATCALAGGVYAAAHTDPDQAREALLFAATAGDGGHAATVAGALLGAMHGPGAFPTEWLARLELVWPGDTLARDLVQQVSENPSGNDYAPGSDPDWWQRYPGA
jgi:ADP-ribosylglycohydrolase